MSQNKMILDHLLEGRTLTSLEALKLFGCFRLSARISELKDKGWQIDSVNIKQNGKIFAEYKINDKVPFYDVKQC